MYFDKFYDKMFDNGVFKEVKRQCGLLWGVHHSKHDKNGKRKGVPFFKHFNDHSKYEKLDNGKRNTLDLIKFFSL